MRHSLTENIWVLGKFDSGATVTLTLYKLSDGSSVTLTSGSCTEIGSIGVFKWNSSDITTPPTSFTEYLWIMTDGSSNQYGKIVLGGFPDESDKIQTILDYIGTPDSGESLLSKISDIPDDVWDEPIAGHLTGDKAGQHLEDADSVADADAIADKVWDETLSEHTNVGSTGEALDDADATADPSAVADAVWDELSSGHISAGSFGDVMRVIKGLSQENYRVVSPNYDGKGNMISGRIKIYANATDCDNDTSPIAQYQITATYDSKSKNTGYKVVKL